MVDTIMANTIPNLDGMSEADLSTFHHKYSRPRRTDAAALIGDTRPGYTNIARHLANYASNKGAAMMCRRSGDITGASIYETICDNIYAKLPEDLKW